MRARPVIASTSAFALALLAIGLLAAAPAQAAAYRYWTYWQGGSAGWTFATAGPGATVPPDGSVEGWRFAVTTKAGRSGDEPGTAPDFAAICGSTPAQDGSKRVALVVDPGPAAIAPAGQTPPAPTATCVVSATDATGYQVLRSVTTLRTDSGLICSLADYPTGECAPVVDDAELDAAAATAPSAGPTPSANAAMPAAAAPGTGSGTPWATLAVGALLLVFAGVGAYRYRRGNRSDAHG
jgi:hypothetical protein